MKSTDIAQELFLLGGELENYTADELIPVLQEADQLYYNDHESFLADDQYDAIRKYTIVLAPHHSYFIGIGAEVRGGKVKLPYEMGSLDQIDIGEIKGWIANWNLDDHYVVITDKLDGTSAMVLYDEKGDLQIAYSRGNGVEGADITRHIKHFVPQNVGRQMVVRGEVILTKENFPKLQSQIKSRGNKEYKNARNMVAGLMNSKTISQVAYDHLDFVAYDMLGNEDNKTDILQDLHEAGFNTPDRLAFLGKDISDLSLTEYLTRRRQHTLYEIDGLVLDVDSLMKRADMNPTRDTLNPAYSVKYKVADASNQAIATVVNVEWNVSKHGYLKPRVEIEPVDLVGVTITHATGFNAKFIHDKGIGPGAKVKLTRSGDVIPFIYDVVEIVDPQMPEGVWEWNDTSVDAILMDSHDHEEVLIQQCIAFFSSIDVPHLKEGTIRRMFELNTYGNFELATSAMINYDKDRWVECVGQNGNKIYDGLKEKLTNIPLYRILGATPFFGRGVGVRKFKKLQQAIPSAGILMAEYGTIKAVDGFEEITATKIRNGMDRFIDWADYLVEAKKISFDYNIDSGDSGSLKGEKIVFTGFRDKDLAAEAETQGGSMQSAVSGKTTIVVTKNPKSNSGKVKKARDLGIRILGIDEFKELL